MIIKPFNYVFWLLITVIAAFCLSVGIIMRNATKTAKNRLILVLWGISCAIYLIYIYVVYHDNEYYSLINTTASWWWLLPLHLCHINILLVPAAVFSHNRIFPGFVAYIAPLGGLMAMIVPSTGFFGYSLFLPRIIGFYAMHSLIVIIGLCMIVLGLFKPDYRVIPGVTGFLFILSFAVYGINILLRRTVLPGANYFFSCDPDNNPLLSLFWSWLPVQYLYELPAAGIAVVYMLIITTIYKSITYFYKIFHSPQAS